MKKIIAAFDGLKFSDSTKDFAVQLAKQSSAHLVAVFLDDFTYHSYKIYDLIRENGQAFESERNRLDKQDEKTRSAAVHNFETACRDAGLEYTIHRDLNIAIQELIHESIYADLLIINSEETLTHYTEKKPTGFICDLLTYAHCPVLIVPTVFKPIDKLLFLYDGEPSSIYAVKMLNYTIASLKQHPLEVLTINSEKQSLHLPDNRLMKEFMKKHFRDVTYNVLKGAPGTAIPNYLETQTGNPLIILGAYHRGKISMLLHESMANTLMKDFNFPMFIAHNK